MADNSLKDKIQLEKLKNLNLKQETEKLKAYIKALSAQKKKKVVLIGAAVLMICVVIVVALSINGSSYVVLYPELSSSETDAVYQALTTLGVRARINENNQVLVPRKDYNRSLLELAAQGYPNSALAYDIFSEHTGLTATETEQKQVLIYQLQDRIQSTLKSMQEISGAVVTLSVPSSSSFAWQQESTQNSTASVMLTLRAGASLSSHQVSAIKNLVAAGVPRLSADDVTVVDASTMVELYGDDGQTSSIEDTWVTRTQNLEFESLIRSQIENNVMRLLAPRYGEDGVVAVAMVKIDYNSMVAEEMELYPDGLPSHLEEEYSINGYEAAGGIVGEEDNTDVPNYAYNNPTDDQGMTNYRREIDYYYGYIKRQIEKGDAELKSASVAVMVAENQMTPALQQELIQLISNAVSIDPTMVSVSSFYSNADTQNNPVNIIEYIESLPLWVLIAAGALLLVLIMVIVIISIVGGKKKKKRRQQEVQEERGEDVQEEIQKYKQELANAAAAKQDAKESAIVEEVREFANNNPEITANLLRSWMKEE